MLSAVLSRVTSIEEKVKVHNSEIESLKNKLNGPLFSENDPISSISDVKEILLRYQARLKEQGFEMTHMGSKLASQEENIQKIKLDLIRLRSEKQRTQQHEQQQLGNYGRELVFSPSKTQTSGTEYLQGQDGANLGSEHILHNTLLTPIQTFCGGSQGNNKLLASGAGLSNAGDFNLEGDIATRYVTESMSQPESQANLRNNTINSKFRLGMPPVSGIDFIMKQQENLSNGTQSQSQSIECQAEVPKRLTDSVGNMSKNPDILALQLELIICKKKMSELEGENLQKDRLLQELAGKQEEYKEREKEFLHKLEWCEHKIRLLKQDKRRRGETIGKLLRSIDEMKDTGKLDLTRAQEGRGILATTLNTRGLSSEQRIQAAINITNTERSPRYRELLAQIRTPENTNAGSDDTEDSTLPRQKEGGRHLVSKNLS